MEQRKRIFISFAILVALVIIFFVVADQVSKNNDIAKYSGLSISDGVSNSGISECLSKLNMSLYISSDDSDTTLKNIAILDYLQYFKIHNCFINNEPCAELGITSYPAWIINGKTYVGELSEEDLMEFSGCH